eukprot:4033457-Pleurochrysis_carterae.AAC.3
MDGRSAYPFAWQKSAFNAMETSHSQNLFSASAKGLNLSGETPNEVRLESFVESYQYWQLRLGAESKRRQWRFCPVLWCQPEDETNQTSRLELAPVDQ